MTQRRDREVQQRELREGYNYKGWTERARMRGMKMERERGLVCGCTEDRESPYGL